MVKAAFPSIFRFAIFLGAIAAASSRIPAKAETPAGSFVCASTSGAREHCDSNEYSSVKLVQKLSKQPCKKGVSWGVDEDGLWVDHGCAARFANSGPAVVQGQTAPAKADQAATDWVCASVNFQPARCPADVSHGIVLVQQLSATSCVQNQSWGYDQSGIWVARGCSAHFAVAQSTYLDHAVAIGGAVGAMLGAPRETRHYNYTTVTTNNYYPRPYPQNNWPSSEPPRPIIYDDAQQRRLLQRQRDSLDQREQALQKQLYQQNMQSQQDEIDRATQAQQRQMYLENQEKQQAEEAEKQRQSQQGQEDHLRKAAEVERKMAEQRAAEAAERQRQIQQGEEDERRQAAEAERKIAEQKAAEEAERQRQIQQGEEDERRQAAEAERKMAEQKAAEEAEHQRQAQQAEEDQRRQAVEAQMKADEERQEAERQRQIQQGEEDERRQAAEAEKKAEEEKQAEIERQIKQGEDLENQMAAEAQKKAEEGK